MEGVAVTVGSTIERLLDMIANLITIVDYFTSTVDAEVHEIRGHTYNTWENLKKFMGKMGVEHKNYELEEIQNRWEKTTESFNESRDSLIDARMLRDEAYSLAAKSAVEDAKKLYWDAMDFLKDYPFLLSTPLVGEVTTQTDEGLAKAERDATQTEDVLAKAERDKISGEVKEVDKKVEDLKITGAGVGGVALGGFAAFSLILSYLERIEGKLKAEQTTGGEPVEQKSGVEKSDREIVVESITNRIDALEEKLDNKLKKIEENILNRIASLIDLIKKSAMPFKDIYDRLCRDLEREWRSSRK